jgi:caa(3)-type oxidase subunit IV
VSEIETTLSESDDTALLPGTAVERADEAKYGLSGIAPDEVPLLPGEESPHPSPFQYVVIAVILCVITALEVGMYYIEEDLPSALYVGVLLSMALVKFITVASWYMHLRTDKRIFRRFFITGAVGAIVLYTIVLAVLHAFEP